MNSSLKRAKKIPASYAHHIQQQKIVKNGKSNVLTKLQQPIPMQNLANRLTGSASVAFTHIHTPATPTTPASSTISHGVQHTTPIPLPQSLRTKPSRTFSATIATQIQPPQKRKHPQQTNLHQNLPP
ncbi:hypothetical protein M758_3G238200 [Ceratodon purpureus]|nr:hypothetical protein M758_3G238200 [Ceratodon purpureus]